MSTDQLSQAISNAFNTGFRDFIVGTLVAALPMLWVAMLVFHLMRPYAIRTLRKLSLRFAADVFWLSYVMLRDALLIITFVISLVFFYPNLLHNDGLPVTATLSTVCLFWALLLKLVRDPDENPMDYQASVVLLVLGSLLYLVPLTFGIEVGSQRHLSGAVSFLTSNTNFDLAIASFYVALALVVVTAGYIFGYVVIRSAPRGGATPVSRAAEQGTPHLGHAGD
jgi:hypothetical protein